MSSLKAMLEFAKLLAIVKIKSQIRNRDLKKSHVLISTKLSVVVIVRVTKSESFNLILPSALTICMSFYAISSVFCFKTSGSLPLETCIKKPLYIDSKVMTGFDFNCILKRSKLSVYIKSENYILRIEIVY